MAIADKLRQIEASLQNRAGPLRIHRMTDTDLVLLADVCFITSAGRSGNEKKVCYVTADGRSHPVNGYLKHIETDLKAIPSFVRTASNYLVNLDRVVNISHDPKGCGYLLSFAGVSEQALVSNNRKQWIKATQEYLDLPTLEHVVPYNSLAKNLRELEIESFPNYPQDDLRLQTKEFLLQHFDDGSHHLNVIKWVRNALWQCYLWIRQGLIDPIDGNIRSFWYSHLKPVYDKFGMKPGKNPAAPISEALSDMVVKRGLFHYWDVGFVDRRANFRRIGNINPQVLFVTEKEGLMSVVDMAYQQWGVTVAAFKGSPSDLDTAYLVRGLRAAQVNLATQPLYIFGFTDFDPAGTYAIAEAFKSQLEQEGAHVALLHHINVPGEYLPAEVKAYWYDIHTKTKRDKALFAHWKRDGYAILRDEHNVYKGLAADSMGGGRARRIFYREAARYLKPASGTPPPALVPAPVDFSRWPGPAF